MSFVVNARFLTQPVTGVQRYAIEVSKQLRRLDRSIRFVAPQNLVHPKLADELGVERWGRLTGHAWEQIELPRAAGSQVLVGLCNSAPLLRRKQVVTLHDAAPFSVPGAFSFAFRNWYRFAFRSIGSRANQIVTPSRFSKQELEAKVGIDGAKINVVPLGHEHVFDVSADTSILDRYNLHGTRFLLAVGSSSPHKNFALLQSAFRLLDRDAYKVVIAGGSSPRIHSAGKDSARIDGIEAVGFVSDSELRALYEHAAAYVHPAFYEGFGLPPLEALALGCPVICSEAASLPEVCGEAAVYFDPHDAGALAEKIDMVMGDPELQRRLSAEGRAQANRFTWRSCAEEIIRLATSASSRTARNYR